MDTEGGGVAPLIITAGGIIKLIALLASKISFFGYKYGAAWPIGVPLFNKLRAWLTKVKVAENKGQAKLVPPSWTWTPSE